MTKRCLFSLALAITPLCAQTIPTQAVPVAGSQSIRTNGTLGTIRLGVTDDGVWFGWRVGIPAAVFRKLTFSDAAAKADALGLNSVVGSDTQILSTEIPKKLTPALLRGERNAVKFRMTELSLAMPAYHVDAIPADEAGRRKLLEFAKAVGAGIVIGTAQPADFAALDKLATELDVRVAVDSKGDPKATIAAMSGMGKNLGVAVDTGSWAKAGIKPADGLALVKDRLMAVNIPGNVAAMSDFFLGAFRASIKPLVITLDVTPGAPDAMADLKRSVEVFEKAMLPAMAARVAQVVDSPVGKIQRGDRLTADMRQQIDAAVPRKAIVQPKKSRKLLVVDLQMYSKAQPQGHATIPHGNWMLELMGKYTGAFEPVFSNDLENLKYPKIKEFDAVFLNNVCGMVFPDAQVREGILRYVREGGGIGGSHAVTYANLNWPEFTDMLGAWSGAHRTEQQVLKIDDPGSPLTKMFDAKGLEHTDEFYHMPSYSPYTREKQHVLMSVDVAKSDMASAGKMCKECTRADHDYAVSWIKSYGKGRVYVTPLGHTTILYTSKQWEEHLLAAIQYMLGDLDADATPSAKIVKK